jgi:hypothetical protein
MSQAIKTKCPKCLQKLAIPPEFVGQTVRCKHCGNAMQIRRKDPVGASSGPGTQPMWEPLPEDLPDFTPAVTSSKPIPKTDYVSPYGEKPKHMGTGRAYRGPANKWTKPIVLAILFLSIAVGAGVTYKLKPGLFNPNAPKDDQTSNSNKDTGDSNTTPGANPGTPALNVGGAFPRRMLAISVHSYLYANSLYNGDNGGDETNRTGTDASIRKLAERWRIPKDQIYHLTDAAVVEKKIPGKKNDPKAVQAKLAKVPPLKSVIEGTIEQFCATSREQDRVIFVFCGHAIEKGGKAYLVPLEGDFDDVPSLIPLEFVYEKLAACKAQEKLAVFDVCRLHTERGVQRPNGGPMSEALETALHNSPEGVSVITACSKGEQSYELDYYSVQKKYEVFGSFFLSYIHAASRDGALSPEKNRLPSATDELPTERWVSFIKEQIPLAVTSAKVVTGATQTPKFTAKKPAAGVAYDAQLALAPRFEFPAPPPSADPKLVQAIIREVEVPSVKAIRADAPPPKISDILPFKEEVLKDYLVGVPKSVDGDDDFQKAVIDGVKGMRAMSEAGSRSNLREEFRGQTTDRAKEEIKQIQQIPADLELQLQGFLDRLEEDEIVELKMKQPKRWQVHYDYVVAQLKYRICYVNQYNLALANVRGDKVPDLQPGQSGYRVAADSKLDEKTPKKYKDLFTDAQKALKELVDKHPGTPWALLAKGDKSQAIGLRIVPSSFEN